MPIEFTGTDEQIEMVNSLAEQAYQEFSNANGLKMVDVHRFSFCAPLSETLARKLRESDFPALIRTSHLPNFHQHVYLGSGWIADPTWQQFFSYLDIEEDDLLVRFLKNVHSHFHRKTTPQPPLPKVLITSLDSLPEILTGYGLKKDLFGYWTKAVTDSLADFE